MVFFAYLHVTVSSHTSFKTCHVASYTGFCSKNYAISDGVLLMSL